MLPTNGFPEDEKCLTFEDGINSYEEYFNKYAYEELKNKIS
jgi:hypothetical protein